MFKKKRKPSILSLRKRDNHVVSPEPSDPDSEPDTPPSDNSDVDLKTPSDSPDSLMSENKNRRSSILALETKSNSGSLGTTEISPPKRLTSDQLALRVHAEIIKSERTYMEMLTHVTTTFFHPFLKRTSNPIIEIVNASAQLDMVLGLSIRLLAEFMRTTTPVEVAKAVRAHVDFLKMYHSYIEAYPALVR